MTANPKSHWPEEDSQPSQLRLFKGIQTKVSSPRQASSIEEIMARGRSADKVCKCNQGNKDDCIPCADGAHNHCSHDDCPLGYD